MVKYEVEIIAEVLLIVLVHAVLVNLYMCNMYASVFGYTCNMYLSAEMP